MNSLAKASGSKNTWSNLHKKHVGIKVQGAGEVTVEMTLTEDWSLPKNFDGFRKAQWAELSFDSIMDKTICHIRCGKIADDFVVPVEDVIELCSRGIPAAKVCLEKSIWYRQATAPHKDGHDFCSINKLDEWMAAVDHFFLDKTQTDKKKWSAKKFTKTNEVVKNVNDAGDGSKIRRGPRPSLPASFKAYDIIYDLNSSERKEMKREVMEYVKILVKNNAERPTVNVPLHLTSCITSDVASLLQACEFFDSIPEGQPLQSGTSHYVNGVLQMEHKQEMNTAELNAVSVQSVEMQDMESSAEANPALSALNGAALPIVIEMVAMGLGDDTPGIVPCTDLVVAPPTIVPRLGLDVGENIDHPLRDENGSKYAMRSNADFHKSSVGKATSRLAFDVLDGYSIRQVDIAKDGQEIESWFLWRDVWKALGYTDGGQTKVFSDLAFRADTHDFAWRVKKDNQNFLPLIHCFSKKQLASDELNGKGRFNAINGILLVNHKGLIHLITRLKDRKPASTWQAYLSNMAENVRKTGYFQDSEAVLPKRQKKVVDAVGDKAPKDVAISLPRFPTPLLSQLKKHYVEVNAPSVEAYFEKMISTINRDSFIDPQLINEAIVVKQGGELDIEREVKVHAESMGMTYEEFLRKAMASTTPTVSDFWNPSIV